MTMIGSWAFISDILGVIVITGRLISKTGAQPMAPTERRPGIFVDDLSVLGFQELHSGLERIFLFYQLTRPSANLLEHLAPLPDGHHSPGELIHRPFRDQPAGLAIMHHFRD